MEIWVSTITVNSSVGLASALKTAVSGDVIKLAAGDYAAVSLKDLHFSGAGVTITSADPLHEARMAGMQLSTSDGLHFSNLEFVVDVTKANPFSVYQSSGITFEGLNVHGSLDNNAQNDGSGLLIRESTNVTVSNSEFHELQFALAHVDDNGLTIKGNQFHDIRTDGVRGGGTSNLTIANNYFTNFEPVKGDHGDAIQLWTSGTKASAVGITITGNVIVRGDGGAMQGVFMRDELTTMPFKNVVIADNLVVGAMNNGIMVTGGEHITIKDNVLAGLPDQVSGIGVQRVSDVTLLNNKATGFNIATTATGVSESGDVLIAVPTDGGKALQAAYLLSHVANMVAGDHTLVSVSELNTQADAAMRVMDTLRQVTTVIVGTSGNDALAVNISHDTRIEAGAGNDNITGGGYGHNTLIGGAGDDYYRVGSKYDVVVEDAGAGNDTVLSTVDYVLPDNVENLTLAGDAHTGAGNVLANRLNGTAGADTLSALGGDDQIQGNDGNDSVLSGEGADAVYGGGGNDTLMGEAGADRMRGDAGDDSISGGSGADTLDGSDGVDRVSGGDDDDMINGGGGNDTLLGDAGNDRLLGDAGNDSISAGAGNDTIDGGAGTDVLSGGAGADRFNFVTLEPNGETIVDFSRLEGDKISLGSIDANVNMTGSQHFAFIGSAAFGKIAGQLHYEVSGSDSYLAGDTNGDGIADFRILMKGVNSFVASDFLL